MAKQSQPEKRNDFNARLRRPGRTKFPTSASISGWSTGRLVSGGLANAVGWWLTFLVLTIAAERLELSRLLAPPPLSQATFVAAVLLILAGAAGDPRPFRLIRRGRCISGPMAF